MAITNYSTLQTAIADHLHRDDLTDAIPDFITGAEHIFNYGFVSPDLSRNIDPLRVQSMVTDDTLTVTDGEATLPTDFLALISAKTGSPSRDLEVRDTGWLTDAYPNGSNGPSSFISLSGTTLTTFYSGTSSIDLKYFAKIPALTDSNTTNWLITKSPMTYLYGALLFSAPYLYDDNRALVWGSMLKQLVDSLNQSDMLRMGRIKTRVRGWVP